MRKQKRTCFFALVSFSALLLPGCYTLKQGYHQARLLYEAKPISRVLEEKRESEARRQKLQWVPRVVQFAHGELGLKDNGGYKKYVALQTPVLTYLVQAAPKRELKLKTWWFPFVGSQPYLGFFKKEDAIFLQKKLQEEGFDTVLGGAEAFSMLGYVADPVYSSMLDNNTTADLVEVLIHELAHGTLYVPGFSSFNENFANFVGVQGAKLFLEKHADSGFSADDFGENRKKTELARQRFQEFLLRARSRLVEFYERAAQNPDMGDESLFLRARELEFDSLSSEYFSFMGGIERGTHYERAFARERFNNTTVLSYALYDAHQGVFERLWKNSGGNMRRFLDTVRACVRNAPETEALLWKRLENCEENVQ